MTTLWDTTYKAALGKRAKRPSGHGWTRIATFENIPSTAVDALIPGEFTYYPGETGNHASVLMDTDIDYEHKVGAAGTRLSRVVLYYRPRTFEEWLETNPNHGVLMGRSSSRSYRMRQALDGTVLEGLDKDDETGTVKWDVIAGTNINFRHLAVYEIYSVVSEDTLTYGDTGIDLYFHQYVSFVGCYNSAPLTFLPVYPGTQRAGQWLLSEISMTPRPSARKLYTCRHSFMFNDDSMTVGENTTYGWARPCVSAEYDMDVHEVGVLDDNNDPTGGSAHVAIFVPTTTANVVKNLIVSDGGRFQDIGALLTNSW